MFSQVAVVVVTTITIIISVCMRVGNLLGVHLKPFMSVS